MTRFQRRKKDRPAEISEAALDEFAQHGYSRTRIADVARRAGVSKGLLYLYFKTKDELFKAVVRSVVLPRVDAMARKLASEDVSVIDFLRGPFLDFMKGLLGSRAPVILRLLMAEGPRHPDLTAWYHEVVVSRGIRTLGDFLKRGVRNGEIRETGLVATPQLLMAPVLLAIMWKNLFERHDPIDSDAMLETWVELLVAGLTPTPDRQGDY